MGQHESCPSGPLLALAAVSVITLKEINGAVNILSPHCATSRKVRVNRTSAYLSNKVVVHSEEEFKKYDFGLYEG